VRLARKRKTGDGRRKSVGARNSADEMLGAERLHQQEDAGWEGVFAGIARPQREEDGRQKTEECDEGAFSGPVYRFTSLLVLQVYRSTYYLPVLSF